MNFQTVNASASPEVQTNENFETIDYSSVYGKRQPVTTALTWGYYGGRWGGFSVAAGTLTLTNAATNYIVVQRSDGAISVSTSSTNWDNTQAYARVYKLTTAGSVVTATEDHRAGPGGIFGSSSTTASGPSSATDNAIARYDGTTGKLLQNSVVTISDTGAIAGAISLSISQGTITDPANAFSVASTWNDAADTFVGIDVAITDTNSAADSVIQRWSSGAGGSTVRMALDKSGRLLIGTGGTSITGSVAANVQIAGTTASASTLGASNWANDSTAGRLEWMKSRGGSIGSHGAVTAGTDLLLLQALGSDGAGFFSAFRLLAEAEGTISTGVVPGRVSLLTADAAGALQEALRIDSAQKIMAGITTAITLGQSNRLQIAGTGSVNGGLGLSRHSADAVSTRLEFAKSRNATAGSNTIAQVGDAVATINALGANGTTYDICAQIIAEIAATPGASADMSGRWRFLTTPDGSATPLDRLWIENDGSVQQYAVFTSSTSYSRMALKVATTTLASVSGATVTATNLIPAKARVLGVNTKVTVALGTGGGTTGYQVGDGSDADRWGNVTGTATTTDTDGNDATADPGGYFNAANNVVITANGGNFNGTGSIRVDVFYTLTEAD